VVLFASFLLPAPIIGVALKMLMLLPPGSLPFHVDDWLASFDDTLLPLLLAYVIRFSPLVALLTEYQLRAVPAELRQAARLESSSVLGTFRTWGAAAVWPAAVAGGIASLALIMGETGATILLIPPGPTTLSVRLMTLMHYAPTSQVSALSFLITLPTLLVFPLLSGLVWLLTLLRGPGRLVRER
jgi:iron(III) transport system permease protein